MSFAVGLAGFLGEMSGLRRWSLIVLELFFLGFLAEALSSVASHEWMFLLLSVRPEANAGKSWVARITDMARKLMLDNLIVLFCA